MKILIKIGLFVALKIAEVSVVVFIPYYLGRFVHLWSGFLCWHDIDVPTHAPMWVIGFISICIVIAIAVMSGLVCWFLKANWDWAGELYKRFRKGV